jgi:hypothetical protein
MAECHPVAFQWVIEAKARGAKVIHVDPRFTRTSALADEYVPIRAGSDIAFVGGLINYVLTEETLRTWTESSPGWMAGSVSTTLIPGATRMGKSRQPAGNGGRFPNRRRSPGTGSGVACGNQRGGRHTGPAAPKPAMSGIPTKL